MLQLTLARKTTPAWFTRKHLPPVGCPVYARWPEFHGYEDRYFQGVVIDVNPMAQHPVKVRDNALNVAYIHAVENITPVLNGILDAASLYLTLAVGDRMLYLRDIHPFTITELSAHIWAKGGLTHLVVVQYADGGKSTLDLNHLDGDLRNLIKLERV